MSRWELRRLLHRHLLLLHLVVWIAASTLLLGIDLLTRQRMSWSTWPIAILSALVLLHGIQAVVEALRSSGAHRLLVDQLPTSAAPRGSASDDDLEELRGRLFDSSRTAREALRASPELVAEVARGESHALSIVSWLDEAQHLRSLVYDHHELRHEVAATLSRPESRATRPALQKLLVQLDAREVKLVALEREIEERHGLLDSFLLAVESATMAQTTDSVLPALSGTLKERADLLGTAVGPEGRETLPPEKERLGGATRASAEGADARRIHRELDLARDLQRSLLPRSAPQVPGLSVAFHYRPCSEVGGDFFDFYQTSPGRLLIAVGDASGHGLDSSMISSMAKSALYTQVAHGRSLEDAMAELNRMMCHTLSSRRLMTFVLAEVDTARRTLSLVNAGQVFPLLRRGEVIREVEQPGYPLGVRNDTVFRRVEEELVPGDVLLLITDGYVEAVDSEGRDYGWDRLAQRLLSLGSTDTEALVAALSEDLLAHLGGVRQQDDVTLVAVRFDPS